MTKGIDLIATHLTWMQQLPQWPLGELYQGSSSHPGNQILNLQKHHLTHSSMPLAVQEDGLLPIFSRHGWLITAIHLAPSDVVLHRGHRIELRLRRKPHLHWRSTCKQDAVCPLKNWVSNKTQVAPAGLQIWRQLMNRVTWKPVPPSDSNDWFTASSPVIL